MVVKKNISDVFRDKILDLYDQGYSSKDICLECGVSAPVVRNVLSAAGRDPRGYRRVSASNNSKILLLYGKGYSYEYISSMLHISPHYIREFVLKNGIKQKFTYSRNSRGQFSKKDVEVKVVSGGMQKTELEDFKELYLSGEYGLSKCAELLSVSDKNFLWFVYHLSDEEKELHHKNLISNIVKMFNEGAFLSNIVKKFDVSVSVVKSAMKQQ